MVDIPEFAGNEILKYQVSSLPGRRDALKERRLETIISLRRRLYEPEARIT
jgi:hypothetical protein